MTIGGGAVRGLGAGGVWKKDKEGIGRVSRGGKGREGRRIGRRARKGTKWE